MEFNKQTYSTSFGFIEYCHIENDSNYPNGLFIFMGSLIYSQYRGQGHFKEMIKDLLSRVPEGTLIQAPVSNKKIVDLFKRIGFKTVGRIEYWENVSNAKIMETSLDKAKLQLI